MCLKEGTISPIFEQRLRDLGSWMNINGEAIYGTQPWIYQNDTINPDVWYKIHELNYKRLIFLIKRYKI